MKKTVKIIFLIILIISIISVVLAEGFCPKCGQPRKEGDKFCSNCGYKFDGNPPQANTPQTNPPQTGGGLIITNIEPLQGGPGTKIKISAQGVQPGNTGIYKVDFNGLPGQIESFQPDALYVIVPPGVSSGPINVYVNGVQIIYGGSSYFTVGNAVITQQPVSTPSTGMTTITLDSLKKQTPVTIPQGSTQSPQMSPTPTAPVSITNISPGSISSGKVVYSSWQKVRTQEDIMLIKPGSKAPVNLTHDNNYNTHPCWSPDGKFIAFTSTREGNREIYIMNEDGTNSRNITGSSFWNDNAQWSPKNNKIAFESWRDGNLEIYVMNLDGSDQLNLTKAQKDDVHPSWSPDASKIAFASNRDKKYGIYVMNSDGTGQRKLSKNASADDIEPAYSPDGTKIAFATNREGSNEIYVMNSDGSNEVNLSKNPLSGDHGPCWSPDGQKIAYMSNRSTTGEIVYWDICVMNSDGSNPFNLSNNSYWDGFPSWVK